VTRQFVGGYIPRYRVASMTAEHFDNITHAFYMAVSPNASCELGQFTDDVFTPLGSSVDKDLVKLHKLSAGKDVKLFATIGGGSGAGSQEMGQAVADCQATLVSNIVAFATAYQLDGIDIDWEAETNWPVVPAAYGLLVSDLRASLPAEMEISITASVNDSAISAEVKDHIDFLQLMTYGPLHSGPVTQWPLAEIETYVADYIAAGYPKERIVIGLPAYGVGTGPSTSYLDIVTASPTIAADVDSVLVGDDTSFFNGIDTIKNKTEYAKINGFKGVMFWELGQDVAPTDAKSLLKATTSVINVGNSSPEITQQSNHVADISAADIIKYGFTGLNGQVAFTIALELYLDDLSNWTAIAIQQEGADTLQRVLLQMHAGALLGSVSNGAKTVYMTEGAPLLLNQWQHITMVYDSTAAVPVKIFVDGVDTAATKRFGVIPTDFKEVPTFTGAFILGSVKLKGKVDNFRVWKKALAAGEVSDLSSDAYDLSTPDASLLISWDFEDTLPNTVFGADNTDVDGTLTSGVIIEEGAL